MTTFFPTFFSEKLFANQNLLHNADIGLRLFRESPEFSINDPRYIGIRTTDALLQRSGWVETTGSGYPLTNTVTVTRRRMPAQPAETKNNYTLFDQFPFTGMGQAEAKAAAFHYVGTIDGVVNPLIMVTNTPFDLGRTVVKDGDAITVNPDSTLSPPNRWLVGWPNPGSGVALMLLEGPLSLFRGPPIYESSHTQHIWLYPQRANMIANPSFDSQNTYYWSSNGTAHGDPAGHRVVRAVRRRQSGHRGVQRLPHHREERWTIQCQGQGQRRSQDRLRVVGGRLRGDGRGLGHRDVHAQPDELHALCRTALLVTDVPGHGPLRVQRLESDHR